MKRTQSEDCVPLDEENFDESFKAAFHAWTHPSIPSEVRAILDDPQAVTVDASSTNFWLLVAALRAFVANEGAGRLPLDGNIPDMHATTDLYLQLQRLYRDQAAAEAAAVEAHLQQILATIGSPSRTIPAAEVKHFCRNARNIRVVRYRTLAEEFGFGDSSTARGSQLAAALSEEGTAANANLYVLLRACDRWVAIGVLPTNCHNTSTCLFAV
eukprot:GHRR01036725.1.p1 GENE.GHRR01036725.1~~GHRR01036725.1.p1  ORF type:complete len:213 (+),score=66.28 GHRR01036725.1:2977-3615(+)